MSQRDEIGEGDEGRWFSLGKRDTQHPFLFSGSKLGREIKLREVDGFLDFLHVLQAIRFFQLV